MRRCHLHGAGGVQLHRAVHVLTDFVHTLVHLGEFQQHLFARAVRPFERRAQLGVDARLTERVRPLVQVGVLAVRAHVVAWVEAPVQ